MTGQHDAFALPGLTRLRQRARLTGLVTGHTEMVGDLVAAPPHHALGLVELLAIGRVGSQDAIARIEQDMGFA